MVSLESEIFSTNFWEHNIKWNRYGTHIFTYNQVRCFPNISKIIPNQCDNFNSFKVRCKKSHFQKGTKKRYQTKSFISCEVPFHKRGTRQSCTLYDKLLQCLVPFLWKGTSYGTEIFVQYLFHLFFHKWALKYLTEKILVIKFLLYHLSTFNILQCFHHII